MPAQGGMTTCYASADLACPTIASNAAGSAMAKSDNTLRSTVMPALVEPGDKSAVVEPERTHRRVEPLNPQRAECALANLAIAKGVLLRFFHGLLGDADRVLAPAVIALGGLVDLLVLGMGGDAAFDASHD